MRNSLLLAGGFVAGVSTVPQAVSAQKPEKKYHSISAELCEEVENAPDVFTTTTSVDEVVLRIRGLAAPYAEGKYVTVKCAYPTKNPTQLVAAQVGTSTSANLDASEIISFTDGKDLTGKNEFEPQVDDIADFISLPHEMGRRINDFPRHADRYRNSFKKFAKLALEEVKKLIQVKTTDKPLKTRKT